MGEAEASEPAEKNALKSIWRAFDARAAIKTLGFFGMWSGSLAANAAAKVMPKNRFGMLTDRFDIQWILNCFLSR